MIPDTEFRLFPTFVSLDCDNSKFGEKNFQRSSRCYAARIIGTNEYLYTRMHRVCVSLCEPSSERAERGNGNRRGEEKKKKKGEGKRSEGRRR